MTNAVLAAKPSSIGADTAHASRRADEVVPYSHSIVPGGFDVTS